MVAYRYSRPHESGRELNDDGVKWMDWVPFSLQLGNLLFENYLYKSPELSYKEEWEKPYMYIQLFSLGLASANIIFGAQLH